MAEVFPTVLRDPAEQTNTLLLGSEAPASAGAARGGGADADARQPAQAGADRRRPARRRGCPGGEVYTDDRAPVEWLVDRSILGYAEDR